MPMVTPLIPSNWDNVISAATSDYLLRFFFMHGLPQQGASSPRLSVANRTIIENLRRLRQVPGVLLVDISAVFPTMM